jgi:class 3 adenylate cyclase/predicted ATPase
VFLLTIPPAREQDHESRIRLPAVSAGLSDARVGDVVNLYEILDRVVDLLRRRGKVTYNALKLQFDLSDDQLAVLKDELLYAHPNVADDAGRGLMWVGDAAVRPVHPAPASRPTPPSAVPAEHPAPPAFPPTTPPPPEAERRQLTVLFCDLADSTRLASRLDPEKLREVVLAYQATGADVFQRFDGYIAQYLGDGLLVYFGYPRAHEDDAQRAIRAGLDLLESMGTLNSRLEQAHDLRLAVRIGIHTGPVVVGHMGGGGRREQLALGETPNLAARLQGLAAPDTVVISEATHRLVQGYFRCDDLGAQPLRGIETPLRVYRVVEDTDVHSRLDAASLRGLTPLIGRDREAGLLWERWTQSHDGQGQVILLGGEAGLGKSRLVRMLAQRVAEIGATHLSWSCSPYHTNSAFHPAIEHLQRQLGWQRGESSAARLAALEQALRAVDLPLPELVPLLATLLALPVPETYPPLPSSPQRQKQKTQEALVAWLLAEATRRPVLAVWEDLHWADPSSLELLEMVLDRVSTARLLLVLTSRSRFPSPWMARPNVTSFALTRLTPLQVEEMVRVMGGGKTLPREVLAQVVARTDGIPLFVEELVKTILEAGLVQEAEDRYVLTGLLPSLAIPATLQDALMARLDRLAVGKDVAQLGAVLGREFVYEILREVAPLDEPTLQHALSSLVEAELLYQRGLPPEATYVFKHALIRDAAYQSLLKSTRQQVHQRIAQALAERFPAITATQPELVAHHYGEAGLIRHALPFWERAGQQSIARSAYVEAINHLGRGLKYLRTLPETPERIAHELSMLMALGRALSATKGYAAPEVGATYTQARALCHRGAQSPELFSVLFGLWQFYALRGDLQIAHELGEELLVLARQLQDPAYLLEAHRSLAFTLFSVGDIDAARSHAEQGIAVYRPGTHHVHAFTYGQDPGTSCLAYAALALWHLGYPEQALQRCHEMLELARELGHPFSLAHAFYFASLVHQHRREVQQARDCAEAAIALANEHGFALYVVRGRLQRSWALAEQGELAQGIDQMRQSLTAYRATGAELVLPYFLARLAEACVRGDRTEEGLRALDEALTLTDKHREGWWKAEIHRLRGVLGLQQAPADAKESEACFRRALAIARRHRARSLELRAAMSLGRLRQRLGDRDEAARLLGEVHGWFTEGFDTADLQEASALLQALRGGTGDDVATDRPVGRLC